MPPKNGQKATLAAVLVALQQAATDREGIARELHEHTVQDTQRFDAVAESLKEISKEGKETGKDVKSLLQTRSFSKGIWWAVSVIAVSVSTVASIVVAWARG